MIVIAEKYGQLGNRLFLFAHFIACAIEHGIKLANPAFDEYAVFFESTERDLFCRFPPRVSLLRSSWLRGRLYWLVSRLTSSLAYRLPNNRAWRVIRISDAEDFDLSTPDFVQMAQTKKFIFVQGWKFRDETSLRKHADMIRRYFTPIERVRRTVEAHLKSARTECDVLVGVHIRQGDYQRFEGGRYFYESHEYSRIMRKVQSLFPERTVGFLICSNTEQPAEVFADFRYSPGPGHFIEDMYALAGCDYIIGPPSTFTLWAAFTGGARLCTLTHRDLEITSESFKSYFVTQPTDWTRSS
jgi:hypothetical protein